MWTCPDEACGAQNPARATTCESCGHERPRTRGTRPVGPAPADRQCAYERQQPRCRMPAGVWPDFGKAGYCAWHVRMRHYPPTEHGFEEFDRFCSTLIDRRVCDVWSHFDVTELYDVVRGRQTGRLTVLERPCPRGWGCAFTDQPPYPQPPPVATALPVWARKGADGVTGEDWTIGERMERASDQLDRYRKWRQDNA